MIFECFIFKVRAQSNKPCESIHSLPDITKYSIESPENTVLKNETTNQLQSHNIILTNIDELLQKDNNIINSISNQPNYKLNGDIKVYVPKQSNIKKKDIESFYYSLSKKREKIKEYLFKHKILNKIEQCPDKLLFTFCCIFCPWNLKKSKHY